MRCRHILFVVLAAWGLCCSCSDDDSFTLSPARLLTFSTDSVKLDTVFSNVPTTTRDFWVYNRSGEGIRCTNVRLERGNQSGFRVNVDGTYLSASAGFQTSDVELRNKDSIRVFVEATTPYNYNGEPKFVDDNLVFTLESGAVQKVNLSVWSWDAQLLSDVHITSDSTLAVASGKPVVVYGGITVDSTATLTLPAGTTLYFHENAGIDVYGRLLSLGQPDQEVVLRGDRLDRMFSDLPYDLISGQWQGIHLHTSSYGNVLQYTDIHSTFDGIVADSSDVSRQKLTLLSSTVHNCQGYGVRSTNSRITLLNSQLTNTLNDCLCIEGGWAEVSSCTLAQFYPFTAYIFSGAALRFLADAHPLEMLTCRNSLVTGAVDDVVMGQQKDSTVAFNYHFSHCILRTPAVEDSLHFADVVFEAPEDTTIVSGRKHFLATSSPYEFSFQLDSLSTAVDRADPATSPQDDRCGHLRDERPDIGAYEYQKENQ